MKIDYQCTRCNLVYRSGDLPPHCEFGPCPMEIVRTRPSKNEQILKMLAFLALLCIAEFGGVYCLHWVLFK